MTTISPAIVRIKKIEPSQPKENFSATDLNNAAQLILDMAGVITPIILLRTEPEAESYRVVEGNFEYYAALQAMEIEPRQRNRINAYIIESEEELPFYRKQVEVFRKQSVATPTEKSVEKTVVPEKAAAIPTQASTIDIQPIINVIKGLSEQVAGIVCQQIKRDTEVDKEFNLLQEAIANISVAKIEKPIITEPEKPNVTKSVTVSTSLKADFLNELNNQDVIQLVDKLKQAKANKTVIKNILSERKDKPFESLKEIVERTKGLGEKTFLTILDNWF